MAKPLRCYMCSDLHAANRTYRKLLNAIKLNVYEARVVLIAGDLTGKAIVPIVAQGNGRYTAAFLDQHYVVETESERQSLEQNISDIGYYPYVTDQDEVVALRADGVLLAALTWIMPGLNAILIPYRRPDLFQLTNNTAKFLGLPRLVWYGIIWLIFIIPVYLAAFVWPVIQAIQASKRASDFVSFSNTSGISWALGLIVLAIIIYFVMRAVNNSRGINTKMIYQELPPD